MKYVSRDANITQVGVTAGAAKERGGGGARADIGAVCFVPAHQPLAARATPAS